MMKLDLNRNVEYTDELCQKISRAIKRSGLYDNVKPIELMNEKFNNVKSTGNATYCPPEKKIKQVNENNDTNISNIDGDIEILSDYPSEKSSELCDKTSHNIIANKYVDEVVKSLEVDVNIEADIKKSSEDTLLDKVNAEKVLVNKPSAKSSNNISGIVMLKNQDDKVVTKNSNLIKENIFQTMLPCPDALFSKVPKSFELDSCEIIDVDAIESSESNLISKDEHKFKEPSPKAPLKEKQKRNLSNLASVYLPMPNKIFAKNSLLESLTSRKHQEFITTLINMNNIENEVSVNDLSDIIEKIIETRMFSVLSELCNKMKTKYCYARIITTKFTSHHVVLVKYKNDFLNCLESMISIEPSENIPLYIKSCIAVNEWNRMLKIILNPELNYHLDKENIQIFMNIFQNFSNQACYFTSDTIASIVEYMLLTYETEAADFISDVWIYSTYHDIIFPELNETILFDNVVLKLIEKLNKNKIHAYMIGSKLLASKWSLIFNDSFCDWLSLTMSDKSDVRRCLSSLYDSINSSQLPNMSEICDHFYLLCINIMSNLNRKSLFTCSKSIYDIFLKNNFHCLKKVLLTKKDKFKFKWTMVECLMSSNDFQYALTVLKEFNALKDLEISSPDYSRAKQTLPNLVWHLINSGPIYPIITLFEEMSKVESAYIKNCNEIFDLIVVRAYESKDKEVLVKMIGSLESVITSDIEFNISLDTLRYLLNAIVDTDVPFNDILDFVETCFSYGLFSEPETTSDGLGTVVDVSGSLTANETSVLLAWVFRHIKVRLVELAQAQQQSSDVVVERLTKVCTVIFNVRLTPDIPHFIGQRVRYTFPNYVNVFSEALTSPRYLSGAVQVSITNKTDIMATVSCDTRSVYNAVYYSNI